MIRSTAQRTNGNRPDPKAPKLVDLKADGHPPLLRLLLPLIRSPIEKTFALEDLNRVYAQYYEKVGACKDPKQIFDLCLTVLKVSYNISVPDLRKIPASGPLVVVANHPFGGIEGVLLGAILLQVRSDVKILGNYLLKNIVGVRDAIIAVDPFETKNSVASNLKGLKEALRWVRAGGALVTFPAGEVSSFQLKHFRVADKKWSPHIGGIIRRTGATALPVYFPGNNGLVFQLLGMLHPRLRTAMLPRELINKKGREIRVYAGRAIARPTLQRYKSDPQLINYIRLSTYFLKNRDGIQKNRLPAITTPIPGEKEKKPIIDPVAPSLMAREVERLPSAQCLLRNGDRCVYIARASQIPNLLNEIGRLREVTFREVDEGTGNAIDLDRFDSYYRHLFLWQHDKQELVGAYRLGLTDEILKQYGPKGLYTNQLFRFKPEFVQQLSTAIEFGRSFIRSEYQKKLSNLLFLWKAVGKFLAAHPHYNILFGPVSISKDYHTVSRNLIVQFLKAHRFDTALSRFVSPRRPYRFRRIEGISNQALRSTFVDIDDISLLISELEADGKGIPILLRHYLKLNGQLISFSVDKSFSNVVDGLLLVDVPHNDPRLIKWWLGRQAYERLVQIYGLPADRDNAEN
ncbi:MAG: lysophospholipid acyltransferase family protein, partial [Planctomycetota bacterium]